MSMPSTIQPPIKGGITPAQNRFISGTKRSNARLIQLRFDPIQELVEIYRKLQVEVEYQEHLRARKIVEISNAQGKERAYYAPTHHAIYDRLINIGEKLLRYAYGRVPEGEDGIRAQATSFVVNLTKKGEEDRLEEPVE